MKKIAMLIGLAVFASFRGACPAAIAPQDAPGLDAILARQPQGPSFDCSLPNLHRIERRICDDARLSRLDLELNDTYATDGFDSYRALDVVNDEAAWLVTRDSCNTSRCVRDAYERRIATLRDDEAATEVRWKRDGANKRGVTFQGGSALTARLAKIVGNSCFAIDGTVDAGDGLPSLLAHTCGECRPVDHFLIFHPEGPIYRVLIDEPECYVSGIYEGFQDERSHGLHRIETFSRDGYANYYEDFYDYDGRVYRHSARLNQRGVPGSRHKQLRLIRGRYSTTVSSAVSRTPSFVLSTR